MSQQSDRQRIQWFARAAAHVLGAVAFLFLWLHMRHVRPSWAPVGSRMYTLYFLALATVAGRYLTGIRYGGRPWHRVLFDGATLLFIALGVRWTGGIASDLWLVYFIYVIAETLADSARNFLITDAVAIASYVAATWPHRLAPAYVEQLGTRLFFLVLVASLARCIAAQHRQRDADLAALREALLVSEERRRLARELHDSIGHSLTRVILSLEVARRQCSVAEGRRQKAEGSEGGSPLASVGEALARDADDLREAMEEMRQLVATLRSDTAPFDLKQSLQAMVAELARSGAMQVRLRLPEEALPLSSHRQYHLSRVIQEALTNCLRHAHVDAAEIELQVAPAAVGPAHVLATIADEGAGFQPDHAGHCPGSGLQGMRERLAPYEGRVTIRSAPGQGTQIIAELPADVGEG
jgi:signal transduction histidine kinase